MEQVKTPNWVERRAHREQLLHTHGGEMWQGVRAAVQDACESFNAHYPSIPNYAVKCKLENGYRIVVSRFIPLDRVTNFQDRTLHVTIGYNSQESAITVAYDEPRGSRTFRITSDDQGVFILDGKTRITPDEISEKALEALFFTPPPPIADDPDE